MSIITSRQTLLKQTSERRKYGMDFSNLMYADETFVDAGYINVVATYKNGTPASDLHIEKPVEISGQVVMFWVSSGTHGFDYRIDVHASGNSSTTYQGDGILQVRDN